MYKSSSRTLLYVTTACVSALIGALPVRAQQTGGVEEIIVTARKRQETILNVPVVETAIPQLQLDRMQVTELTDLPKIVPGLNFGHQLLSIGTQVSIRGIGTSSSDPGVDQSVSLNIDGLSLGNGLAFGSGMFDLQQVEVLKGPQALFYGKSSPGGVISLRTADPTDKLEVMGRVGYEVESVTPREELVLSGPITDSFKVRLAGMYSHSDGYFNNIGTPDTALGGLAPAHPNAPYGSAYQIRGTALWDPSSQFSARLKVNLVHDKYDNAESAQLTDCPDGTGGVPPFNIPFLGGGEDCKLDRNLRVIGLNPANFPGILNGGTPFLENYQRYGTLELNYHPVQDLTLTSTTAFYHLHSESMVNAIETTFVPILGVNNHFRRKELTEEVRLNSDFTTPLNFTVGGLYEDGNLYDHVTLFGNTALGLPGLLEDGVTPFTIKTYSMFGQLRYQVLPQVELAGGLRWTDETRVESPTLFGAPVAVLTPRLHSSNVAPEFTVTYKPTDDMTLFAAYKQAYKSGSFSVATPVSPTAPGTPLPDNSFGDEKVQGGEVGLKSRLMDRQLAFNAATYYYKYTGLQVGAIEPAVNGLPVIQTVNAASATTYGIDLDAHYRPESIKGLGLTGALNWNHARYGTFTNAPCWGGQTIADGCSEDLASDGFFHAQNLSGTRIVRAPDWQMNFGFDYEFPVLNDYTMILSESNEYSSSYETFVAVGRPNNDNFQSGYLKADLSLTVQSPNKKWELAFIGKNITDKITSGNCSPADYANGVLFGGEVTGGTGRGPAGVDEVGCFSDPGREVWIRLTVRPFN